LAQNTGIEKVFNPKTKQKPNFLFPSLFSATQCPPFLLPPFPSSSNVWDGSSFVTFLSSVISHVMVGYTVIVATLAYFLLFNSFFISRHQIPLSLSLFHQCLASGTSMLIFFYLLIFEKIVYASGAAGNMIPKWTWVSWMFVSL
jgi:hypothetical protein